MARDVIFDENIPQEDVNHATDDYWSDVRLYARVAKKGGAKYVEDYEHLVGCIFYDPEYHELDIVTRVDEEKGKLVGWLSKIVDGVQAEVEHERMHVAEIEKLLGIYELEEGDEDGGRAYIAGHDELETRDRSYLGEVLAGAAAMLEARDRSDQGNV